MSTNMMTFSPDEYGRREAEGVAQNAVFSAFYSLVSQRRTEGVTKSAIAEKMNVDRATITRITSDPTNMKISTMASLANALDAEMVIILVDRSHRGRFFTSIGMHISQNSPMNVAFNPDALRLSSVMNADCVNSANSVFHVSGA
jgi:transcriptional regulator with XRE-family HTH domain